MEKYSHEEKLNFRIGRSQEMFKYTFQANRLSSSYHMTKRLGLNPHESRYFNGMLAMRLLKDQQEEDSDRVGNYDYSSELPLAETLLPAIVNPVARARGRLERSADVLRGLEANALKSVKGSDIFDSTDKQLLFRRCINDLFVRLRFADDDKAAIDIWVGNWKKEISEFNIGKTTDISEI